MNKRRAMANAHGTTSAPRAHAIHSCGITDDDGSIVYGGEAAGYVLTFEDGRVVYFAGDTNVFSDMELIAEIYQPELAFLPIGDFYTMSPREAAVACRLLGLLLGLLLGRRVGVVRSSRLRGAGGGR